MSALLFKRSQTVVYLILLIATASIFSLSGCTSAPDTDDMVEIFTAQEAVSEATETGSRQSNRGLKAAIQRILEQPFDSETTSRLVEAELVAYRGDLGRAIALYAKEAQEHQDIGLARRYTELAVASEDPFNFLDSSLLWRELDPESELAERLAITALARMGEVEGAWELILAKPQNHVSVRVLAAEIFDAKYTPQMIWVAEQITDTWGQRPNSAELLIALSILSEGTDQIQAAISYAESASTLQPSNPLPVRLQVRALLQSARTEDAIGVITQFIDSDHSNENDRTLMARTLASIDQKAALPVFLRLADKYPRSSELQLGAGELLLSAQRIEEAEDHYIRLSRTGDHRNVAYFNLGRISEFRGDLVRAREYYQLVESGELEYEAQLRAALTLADADSHYINDQFDALRTQFPEQSASLYHDQGRLLTSSDRSQQGIAIFSQGLVAHPGNEALLYARSVSHEAADNVDQAIADLREILSANPDSVSAMNALGYTLANRTDNYDEAYQLIMKALAMNPDDPAIIDSMGWVLYRLGKHEEALQYLARAHQAMFDVEIVSHLAEVLVSLNRVDDAKQLIEDSLQRLPNNEILRTWQQRL